MEELNYITLAEDPGHGLPDQFSICSSQFLANMVSKPSWVQVLKEDYTHWFFIYQNINSVGGDTTDINHSLWTNVNGAFSYLGDFGSLRYNRWFHLCVSLDLRTGLISPVVDGIVIPPREVPDLGKGAPSSLAGRLILGKYWRNGVWNQDNSMVGNLQVFGRLLSEEEMVGITGGEDCGTEGDYMAWHQVVGVHYTHNLIISR